MPIIADFDLYRILPVYYIRVMDNVLSLMVPVENSSRQITHFYLVIFITAIATNNITYSKIFHNTT